MQFIDLPEEILIIIIQKLDVASQHSLYNTCKLMKSVVCMPGVLKKCYLSRNTMATANTLQLIFFKEISYHLLELNMSGVADLCKTKLLPALKKLQRLKVLDISYTDLIIPDLIAIHDICPTIKDITINYRFNNNFKSDTVPLPSSILLMCQSAFEHFENVTFIGSIMNLLISSLPLYLLAKARLHSLKFLVIVDPFFKIIYNDKISNSLIYPEFDKFTIYILDWKFGNTLLIFNSNWLNSHTLAMLQLNKYEYIVIVMYNFDFKIYASPRFSNFFKDEFQVAVECSLNEITFLMLNTIREPPLNGNVVFMVWNKETTIFDENFYYTLSKHVKQYFPYNFKLGGELPAPRKYDWFYITPIPNVSKNEEDVMGGIKRRRVAAPNFILNYDVIFNEEDKIELSIDFKYPIHNAIGLIDGCVYLRKLTYFSLFEIKRYSSDFFNILFRCCVNLVTLNVYSPAATQCASAISRSLSLTKSLKNLRIVEKMIDFNSSFASFCQCLTLENIYIAEYTLMHTTSYETNDFGNPSSVVEALAQLYSVYIEAPISRTTRKKALQLLNKAKNKYNKHYVNVQVYSTIENNFNGSSYDRFVDIFKLSPVRPV